MRSENYATKLQDSACLKSLRLYGVYPADKAARDVRPEFCIVKYPCLKNIHERYKVPKIDNARSQNDRSCSMHREKMTFET